MSCGKIIGNRVVPSEDDEQIAVFAWAEMMVSRWPELELMHHIPNGGKRSKSESARFRAMGVKSGVSDIFLPCARRGYHGLYIELKTEGGRLSENQREFLRRVNDGGYLGVVCIGAERAIRVISAYLGGESA